jgi:hypothetical protein
MAIVPQGILIDVRLERLTLSPMADLPVQAQVEAAQKDELARVISSVTLVTANGGSAAVT